MQDAGASVRADTVKLLNKKGPKLDRVLLRLRQALSAKETKFFQFQGMVMDSREVVAHNIRLNAAKLALELHDAMPKTGVEKAAETIEDVLRAIHADRGNL